MSHKVMRSARPAPRQKRITVPPPEQYSLFAAAAGGPDADARHFERQARLCQRLLAGLHQPELVELLGRLHDEYEAKAGTVGSLAVAEDDPTLR